jgi:hypothetical protein
MEMVRVGNCDVFCCWCSLLLCSIDCFACHGGNVTD